jgi:two-component system KDP operon response regulator KdpE
VVDDDPIVVKTVRRILQDNGFMVSEAMNGESAMQSAEKQSPDLVVLDIMMPGTNGFEVYRRLRELYNVPVIMLSAIDDVSTKVRCLDEGIDDYLTKPFSPDELTARVKSVLRRSKVSPQVSTQYYTAKGDVKIDFDERKVTVAGKSVKLTPTEYAVLYELLNNAGKVLTHRYLLRTVWGPEYDREKEYLHVFINRIRRKLSEQAPDREFITCASGIGYVFRIHEGETLRETTPIKEESAEPA